MIIVMKAEVEWCFEEIEGGADVGIVKKPLDLIADLSYAWKVR